MRLKSIKSKLAAIVGPAVFATTLVLLGLFHLETVEMTALFTESSKTIVERVVLEDRITVLESEKEKIGSIARSVASEARAIVRRTQEMSKFIAKILTGVKDPQIGLKLGREEVLALLKGILVENVEMSAVFTCWEPDAFDGLDQIYAGSEGHDDTGRFMPACVRSPDGAAACIPVTKGFEEKGGEGPSPGKTIIETLVGKSRASGSAITFDSLDAGPEGMSVPVVISAAPIAHNGNFFGVAGVKLPLGFFQKYVETISRQNSRQGLEICVIGTDGTCIATSVDSKMVGQRGYLTDSASDRTDEVFMADGFAVVLLPIEAGEGGWTVRVRVPEKMIFRAVSNRQSELYALSDERLSRLTSIGRDSLKKISVAGAGLALAVLILLWVALSGILRPMAVIERGAAMIGFGDIKWDRRFLDEIEGISKRDDELGATGKSFMKVSEYMAGKASAADRMANGDLTVKIETVSQGDVLGKSFKEMIGSIGKALALVDDISGNLDRGAVQLSSASESMSDNASSQAAAVQQIGSSLVELMGKSESNSSISGQALDLSRGCTSASEDGLKRAEELDEAMMEIVHASERIGKIMKVVDDIAFQTNLLSLNAAVEAARAGRAGKGFAVVASEVRSLAMRSAKSASETAEVVDEAKRRIELGRQKAVKIREALVSITSSVAKVSTILSEITKASMDQAVSVKTIGQGVEHIDSIAQSNAAEAQQMAASAAELSKWAAELRGVLDGFALNSQV